VNRGLLIMADADSRPTLADYVASAVSPALIMALVGSLVFFLLELLYQGQYEGRLQWTLFFFVFAIVLIARVSMWGEGRAGLYGLALAMVTWLALQMYVEYPAGTPLAALGWAINLGLMAVVWWSAHRLTWDCTFTDEKEEAAGEGLLQAAGLDQFAGRDEPGRDPGGDTQAREPDEASKGQTGLWRWWQRYRRYREERRRRPRTPGVWVVYFSLAALPLFGLGQSLIRPDEVARRQYVFWLMVVYVGSGLGLLLTTSFVGLRQYVRRRNLRMPVSMAGMWLTVGGILVVALLGVGAVLPRPQPEYSLVQFVPLGSPERHASRWAAKNDSPAKGEGRPSSAPPNEKSKPDRPADNQPGRTGEAGQPQDHRKDGQRQGASRDSKGQKSSEGERSSQDPQEGGDGQRGKGQAKGKSGERQGQDRRDEQEAERGRKGQSQGLPADKPRQATRKADRSGSDAGSRTSTPPGNPTSGFIGFLSNLAPFLRWAVFAILAAVVLFFLVRGGLQFLANFTHWARRLLDAWRAWWHGLWAGLSGRAAEDVEEPGAAAHPRPFASFRNPFDNGSGDRRPLRELVRYSFEALEAWAREQGLPRPPDETPGEFAGRVGDAFPALETEARRLADLYARVAYAREPLPAAGRPALQHFWQRLLAVAEQPLSA
jgi:hypothetical protein